jgi:hypothetical protein
MMRKELKSDSNFDVILLHLQSEEGSVVLNETQQTLLTRWQAADEYIRRNEMRREAIAKLIMGRFSVSRVTAYQDIVNAENLFASSTPLNKKYRIGLRIEFIEMKIAELYDRVHMGPVDEAGNKIQDEEEDLSIKLQRIQNNVEYLHEAKELEKILQKYYHDYPDASPRRSPKTIQYNMIFANLPAAAMTVEEALRADGKMIDIKESKNGSGK